MYQHSDPLNQRELSEPQKQADDQVMAYCSLYAGTFGMGNKRIRNFKFFVWLALSEKSGKIAPDDNKIIADYTDRYILNYGN